MKRLPRRYAKPVKFLTQMVSDKKVITKLRLEAALRLTTIYLQFDEAQLRREIAKDRAETRKAEAAARIAALTASSSPLDEMDIAEPSSLDNDASALMSGVMASLLKMKSEGDNL